MTSDENISNIALYFIKESIIEPKDVFKLL